MNESSSELSNGRYDEVQDILGPPALLSGESEVEFYALLEQVRNSVRPRDTVEACYLRHAVDYLWEVRRYRRAVAQLIDSSSASGLWQMLNFVISDRQKRLDVVSRWARGEPEARREVSDLLQKAGLDETHISAHTMAALTPHLDVLTREVHVASARMESLFREVDRRRDGFARRLKGGLAEIEDAQIVEAEPRPRRQ